MKIALNLPLFKKKLAVLLITSLSNGNSAVNGANNHKLYSLLESSKTLEEEIAALLQIEGAKLSCAESCTGGYISHLCTAVPSLSKNFKGSVISYSPELKKNLLWVKKETIEKEGLVSKQCAAEMLEGLLSLTETTYGIAITGYAGPDGGTEESPVGTAWIAVGTKETMDIKKVHFFIDRDENICAFSIAALQQLKEFIEHQKLPK